MGKSHQSQVGVTYLRRQVGLQGAVFLGLGSILGTGIFVSTGLVAGVAGPMALVAVILAGFLALCNAVVLSFLQIIPQVEVVLNLAIS